jgi:hypothetical protein
VEFYSTGITHFAGTFTHPKYPVMKFRFESTSVDGALFKFSVHDYNDSLCAIGSFRTQAECLEQWDKFISKFIPSYDEKRAKYGDVPIFELNASGDWAETHSNLISSERKSQSSK